MSEFKVGDRVRWARGSDSGAGAVYEVDGTEPRYRVVRYNYGGSVWFHTDQLQHEKQPVDPKPKAAAQTEATFYIVWNSGGGIFPVRYEIHEEAVARAEQLANQDPGAEFFVLRATDKRVVGQMQRKTLTAGEEEMPF